MLPAFLRKLQGLRRKQDIRFVIVISLCCHASCSFCGVALVTTFGFTWFVWQLTTLCHVVGWSSTKFKPYPEQVKANHVANDEPLHKSTAQNRPRLYFTIREWLTTTCSEASNLWRLEMKIPKIVPTLPSSAVVWAELEIFVVLRLWQSHVSLHEKLFLFHVH